MNKFGIWVWRCAAILAIAVLWTAAAAAQQPPEPGGDDNRAGNNRAGNNDNGLPDVIVEPQEPLLTDSDPATSPFDLPGSYPSLSQQIFPDLNGVTRGQRSVFEDPRPIELIGPLDLNERAPTDMGEALERATGVTVQRTGRGQVSPFIRGLTGQQVLILVDGVRMTNATFRAGPNQYFSLIDPNMVERLEVVRGPQSVLWGSDAIGGVINVVTRSPSLTGYDYLTGGTVQRFSSSDLGYQGRLDAEGWVGSTGAYGGVGYGNFNNVERGGDLGRQPATSFRYFSGDVKLRYQLDCCSELILAAQHFEQNDVFRSDQFPRGRERIFDPQQRDLFYIRWQGHSCGWMYDTYAVTASFHRLNEEQFRREDNMNNFDSESRRRFADNQTGFNAVFSRDMDCWGRLTYGADWYHDHIDSGRTDVDFTTNPPTLTERAGGFPDDSYYTRLGAFLEWDVDLTDRLTAIAGVRYSYIQAGADITLGSVSGFIKPEYSDVTSSIGLSYELTPCCRLVGSIAEGFRAPNLDDLAALNDQTFAGTQIPNPNLDPERSLNYEVGIKIDQERLRAQAFVFWTDIENFILRVPQGDPLDPNFLLVRENRRAELNGVELAGEYLLPDGWSVYGNFSYVIGNDTVVNEPLSRVNPTQGVLGLRWRDECGCNWFDVYVWAVRRQDRLSTRDRTDIFRIPADGTPGFATLNFRYGHMITERQRITVNVANVTDKAYRVHGSGADGPGIDVLLGYEWLR